MYNYGSSARPTLWNEISGYKVPPASLEGNQPWLQHITEAGVPYWRHMKSGEMVWKMPDAFKGAMLLGGITIRVGSGGYLLGYDTASDEVTEQQIIEYTMRISMNDADRPTTAEKEKPTIRKDQDKNLLASRRPTYEKNTHVHPDLAYGNVHEPGHGKCTACFTDTSVSQAPCGCKYCPNCLAGIFIRALENERFFQPSCCGRLIPIELAAPILEQTGLGVQIKARTMKAVAAEEEEGRHKRKTKGKGKAVVAVASGSKGIANKKLEEKVDCLICMETFTKKQVFKTACQHSYCRGCMKRLFLEATKNESLYPPKCCNQNIPLTVANVVLNSVQQIEFNTKGNEWRTKNRLYCSTKTCSAFITPLYIKKDIGTCNQCHKRTCVHCKGPYHRGDCPKDKGIQEVLHFAQKAGWRKCYSCKMFVELNAGCNHITCLCGAQFCYVCGSKWPTCRCKIWQEGNLNTELLQEVRRDNPRVQYRQYGDHGNPENLLFRILRDNPWQQNGLAGNRYAGFKPENHLRPAPRSQSETFNPMDPL